MKQQEIFNKAAVHLMGMEGPSLDQDNDACAYRGKDEDCEFNGQMCAVGLFIKDEHYDDDLEGSRYKRWTGCCGRCFEVVGSRSL